MGKGRLFLIPSWLDEHNSSAQFPSSTLEQVAALTHFIVERAKTARHFLKRIDYPHHFDEVLMLELNKHGDDHGRELLAPCLEGKDMGLLSEAGVPGVADPGGSIVEAAHELGITVVPLIGPSSLLLALMASGMNGQRFQFHGYLPRDERDLARQLRDMEQESRQHATTHMFIETPYRNDKLMSVALRTLHPTTRFCVAKSLTSPTEEVVSQAVEGWKRQPREIGKQPAVFLLFAGKNQG